MLQNNLIEISLLALITYLVKLFRIPHPHPTHTHILHTTLKIPVIDISKTVSWEKLFSP
jgi:ABC-type Co2+ transport system permease subunit